jgi:hypothetical protein
METATLSDLHDFAELWVNVGCAKKSIAPVLRAVTRQRELDDEYAAALVESVSPMGLAQALASGDVRVVEALHVAADHTLLHGDLARGLVKEAQVALHKEAMAFILTNADTLATEADAVSSGPRGWLERFGGITPRVEEPPRAPTAEEIAAAGYVMDRLPDIRTGALEVGDSSTP